MLLRNAIFAVFIFQRMIEVYNIFLFRILAKCWNLVRRHFFLLYMLDLKRPLLWWVFLICLCEHAKWKVVKLSIPLPGNFSLSLVSRVRIDGVVFYFPISFMVLVWFILEKSFSCGPQLLLCAVGCSNSLIGILLTVAIAVCSMHLPHFVMFVSSVINILFF